MILLDRAPRPAPCFILRGALTKVCEFKDLALGLV